MNTTTGGTALPQIQAKLSDISEILKQLPKELQAKALGDIESLASNIKGKLIKSEDSDENFLSVSSVHEKTQQLDTFQAVEKNSSDVNENGDELGIDFLDEYNDEQETEIIARRTSTRNIIPKRHSDYIVDLPGKKIKEGTQDEAPIAVDNKREGFNEDLKERDITTKEIGIPKKKPERCLVCRKKCKDKVALREHMQIAHKIKMEVSKVKKTEQIKPRKGSKDMQKKTPVDSSTKAAENDEVTDNPHQLAEITTIKEEDMEQDECDKDTNTKDVSDKENVKEKKSFQCPLCDKKLSREIGLKQHMSRFHLKELPTKCDQCNKTYSSYKHLLSHKRIIHGDKRFYCDQCSYNTKHHLDLKRHIIRFHGTIKDYPYECNVCRKRFITTTTLRKHSEVHNENRPIQDCKYDGCDFKTRSTMSMTIHLRNKHLGLQKYFECEFCGKKLGAKVTYETHLRRHKGQYIFRCVKCSASFPCRTQLSAHAATHGEKNEECPTCGKKFSSKAKVQRHQMVHSGEKKHSCPWCQYKCNLDTNLRKHCCARHNIEYPPKRRPVVRLEYVGQEEESLNTMKPPPGYEKNRKILPNILRKQQKVEFVLSRSEDGSLDTADIIKFLESQGFYGQQMIQVEVGGQTFVINSNKTKSETKETEQDSIPAASSNAIKLPDNTADVSVHESENVALQFTNNDNSNSDVINKFSPLDEVNTLKYNLGNSESIKYSLDNQESSTQISDISGLLSLQDIKMEEGNNTNNVQLPSDGGIENVDGECILSEETLQQITMLGDSNNTVIVIQQPDGTYEVQQSQASSMTGNVVTESLSAVDDLIKTEVPQEQYEITVGRSSTDISEGFGQEVVESLADNSDNKYDVIYANVKDNNGFEISGLDTDGQVILSSGGTCGAGIDEFQPDQVGQMLVVNQDQI